MTGSIGSTRYDERMETVSEEIVWMVLRHDDGARAAVGEDFWIGRKVTTSRSWLDARDIGEVFDDGGTFIYWQIEPAEAYRTPETMTIVRETAWRSE